MQVLSSPSRSTTFLSAPSTPPTNAPAYSLEREVSRMNRVSTLMLVALAAVTLAACSSGGSTIAKAPKHKTPAPNATPAPDYNAGPSLGAPIRLQDQEEDIFNVTVVSVDQNARGANSSYQPEAGEHFVGVQLSFTGLSGTYQNSVNDGVTVMGTDQKEYAANDVSATIADGTDFDNGEILLGAGETISGWVTLQMPLRVKAATVRYDPGLGQVADKVGQWAVGS